MDELHRGGEFRDVWEGLGYPLVVPPDESALPRDAWERAGFYNRRTEPVRDLRDGAFVSSHLYGFPYWSAFSPTVLLPVIWVVRWTIPHARRRYRVRRGLCPSCGYASAPRPSGARSVGRRLNRRLTRRCGGPPRCRAAW